MLLVRVANWRTLATRDAKGITTFRTNVGKPSSRSRNSKRPRCRRTLRDAGAVKAGVAKYSEAFDKTAPNLLLGDELYYKAITPLTVMRSESSTGSRKRSGKIHQDDRRNRRADQRHHHHAGNRGRRRRAARPADRVPDRARHHQAAVRPDLRHEGTRRRQFRRGAARARPQGRSRRHGAGGRDLQGQGRGEGARGGRSQDQAGPDRRASSARRT